ncbi:MAG: protein-export membrane protein SecF [Candidatus Buchananbacteria bacterium RIFCSPHIGHO2_01_FULL_39_14]|uniref:Protein-export membrane protein SecF n=1 Tax=Candidatus Buchananbacteria bacterium RIFCSPHIGHO2_01_FULL_39_14 TaxID=1797532 RepID=A0A1G1XSJ4_9BACT|nr:MAG: protein-export membrane protein SecF [Candidatus Buchananbacteria bacterium RIFCSPHIGHO2_01_FULL_39_14]OGY48897.1 MAG: protein-export membrane protein SecF [Candidatus Buchananbacteria bacterium RIFCSPHIGHO2_02_FULL_39_17]
MISIINTRKIWFTLSGSLVLISIISFFIWGLNLGIDFTGGSLLEVEFMVMRPNQSDVNQALAELNLGNIVSQPVGEKGMIIRFKDVNEEIHQKILQTLKEKFKPSDALNLPEGQGINFEIKIIEEKRFDSIGPVIGQELKNKTIWAIIIVLIAIVIYIAWAFRKVSKPVASWKYGLIAVLALFHDITITVGVFVILGKFYNLEANAPFVAALLTVLGYSVNDTIVVFDRIRENLIKHLGEDFDKIVDQSINEVIVRSINTSFTVLLALLALLLFGGATIRDFILALIVGISVGTYSSIFLASPLLVIWEKFKTK